VQDGTTADEAGAGATAGSGEGEGRGGDCGERAGRTEREKGRGGERAMKAITLTQPYATLIAIGAKRIETRSWRTSYRGPLAIHAAKGFPVNAREFAGRRLVNGLLVTAGYATADRNCGLPIGAVIATCRLISCLPMRELQDNRTIETDLFAKAPVFTLDDQERAFGDYSLGRWAWLLADIVPFAEPIPAKGALSLWEWNAEDVPANARKKQPDRHRFAQS
jgi:hypothetical protein